MGTWINEYEKAEYTLACMVASNSIGCDECIRIR
jgi:hypothetical protein